MSGRPVARWAGPRPAWRPWIPVGWVGLSLVDAQYETTSYLCDLLWGPESWQGAAAWLKEQQPEGDEVDVLDRLFLIQHHENRVYLPRSADVAAGLNEDERHGTWFLIRADYPADVIGHTRQLAEGQSSCAPEGPCGQCAAHTVGIGNWQEMIDLAAASGLSINPRRPPDTRVPSIKELASIQRDHPAQHRGRGSELAVDSPRSDRVLRHRRPPGHLPAQDSP